MWGEARSLRIYQDSRQRYRWQLVDAGGRTVAISVGAGHRTFERVVDACNALFAAVDDREIRSQLGIYNRRLGREWKE